MLQRGLGWCLWLRFGPRGRLGDLVGHLGLQGGGGLV
jgi:hypothetical protein